MAEKFFLKLFVSGRSSRSKDIVNSIQNAFLAQFSEKGTLEVIDVLEKPELANEEQVLATPTLIRVLPEPSRRLIGDFSDGKKILDLLELGGDTS